MVLNKKQKQELSDWISKLLKESKSTVFIQFQGLNVNDTSDLRNKLREREVGCRVVKNTILQKAAKKSDIKINKELLDGKTIALAYSSKDEVEPSKIVYKFGKDNKAVKLIGGVVNANFINETSIVALAKLPGREELYAKIIGSLSAPLSGMVNVLKGNLRGLVSVLKQYGEQKS